MTTRILFLHSAGPQDEEQGSSVLLSFIEKELGSFYKIYSPKIPDPENPTYKVWKTGLEKQLDLIDDEVILVGHSLGASVLLKYFSEVPYQKPIAGLFLVAAPYWGADGWELEEFTLKPNFPTHLTSIPHIGIYHSQDDEWVPVAHATHYQTKLPAATVRILRQRGHIFDAGLPELIHDIKSLSGKQTHLLTNIGMKINTQALAAELRENARELASVIESFSDSRINIVPFEGSWTAGQVCDHLLKSGSGMPEVLLENTSQANRAADQHVEMIRTMFLDFRSKMQSPEFIIPSSGPFDKKYLADTLQHNLEEIVRITETEDLTCVCERFAFPGIGNLTRYEWINFLSCHTKRHTHQMKNILAAI